MKRLWAPWRIKFIESHNPACVFCQVRDEQADQQNFVITRGVHCFVMLNRYPYTSGHILIIANDHLSTLESLSIEARSEMIELATHATRVLGMVYHPDGFNVGSNIGSAAGAGIAGHVHMHVVPRWTGDMNFMGTLADTKVMPEALDETYQRLLTGWSQF